MKYIYLLIFFIFTSLNAGEVKVAVAANVSYAMDELIQKFNQTHPNTSVKTTLGSSGKLTTQIFHGAPYDILLSADMSYPNKLYIQKLAIQKPLVYANGSLAIFSAKKYDLVQGIEFLKNSAITRVAIANPKTAPYGKATIEALKKAKLFQQVKPKLVYAESISSVVSYALTATDVGVIAKSSLYSKKISDYKENINWVEIAPNLYTPIEQGIALLSTNQEAKNFYDFILSHTAKNILKKYGYKQ
ncbi:molybdate ABC transporter substrate-binding protein [Sulfurimonas sp.]|nr:molybdate ABC transporter substrate-binding protein [Sulfurimonas sp.]